MRQQTAWQRLHSRGMSKARGLIGNTNASQQIYIKHLLSKFLSKYRKSYWQNIFLKIMVALDKDDPDIQGGTPVSFSPGGCPGFQRLLGKAVDLLEVPFPASPVQVA